MAQFYFKPLYIRNNENYTIKPLGVANGTVLKYGIHLIPKFDNVTNVSMIECIGEDCYICKLVEWLKANSMFDKVKSKFKQLGTHFNVAKQNLYILPVYYYTNKRYESAPSFTRPVF